MVTSWPAQFMKFTSWLRLMMAPPRYSPPEIWDTSLVNNGTYTSWCIRYSWVMTGMTPLNRGCRCRLIRLIYRMAKRGIEIEDVKKISWQMQSDTRRRKRYAMSEKRSCEWRVTLTCEKKLIVIACVLEGIRVRRTLVWCYLDVCTAIELIVLCFMFLSREVLCCLFFVLPT